MKREMISEAIGNIDEKFVSEAGEEMSDGVEVQTTKGLGVKIKRKSSKESAGWRKYLPMAACICLLVVGVGGFAAFKVAHPWSFRIETVEGRRGETETLTAIIPRWEELTISQQYSSMEWKGMDYDSQNAEIPAERIGEFLGEVQAVGYDHYADEERRINAKVYSVTELSEECVLAVQYEGTDTWYGFRHTWYRPETLGQFIEDMNIYEDVVFDTVHYSYNNVFGQYVSVSFDDVEQEKVHQYLLSNLNAVNTHDDALLHLAPREIMGVSVDIPILGVENISLQVCQDGYIKTNIMGTGKLFYIGEENTQAFVDYVLNECDGYETIYIYEESGVIDSLFGGNPENGFWDSLFDGEEGGASDPSVSPATQSSQGYNPEGAASPSVTPAVGGNSREGNASMTSPSRPAANSGE